MALMPPKQAWPPWLQSTRLLPVAPPDPGTAACAPIVTKGPRLSSCCVRCVGLRRAGDVAAIAAGPTSWLVCLDGPAVGTLRARQSVGVCDGFAVGFQPHPLANDRTPFPCNAMVKLLAEDASIFLASVDVACSAHLLPGTGSTSTPNLKWCCTTVRQGVCWVLCKAGYCACPLHYRNFATRRVGVRPRYQTAHKVPSASPRRCLA